MTKFRLSRADNTNPRASTWGMLGVLLSLTACGHEGSASAGTEPDSDVTTSSSLDTLTQVHPIGPGASGVEVRAVHDYLSRYGYFENPALRSRYPWWSPVVASEPAPDVYDGTTEAAVRAYQRLNGLPETGVIDAATLAQMKLPRCAYPDVSPDRPEVQDKYLLHARSYPLTTTTISYGFTNTFTSAQKTAVRAALATWAGATNLTFQENTSSPSSAQMKFTMGTGGGGGFTATSWAGNDITGSTTTFGGGLSIGLLQHVALHESGHGLGLDHSAYSAAVMYPTAVAASITLTTDDATAISLKYSPWETIPGNARELASSPEGVVYKLSDSVQLPGGFEISRWVEASRTWVVQSTTFGALQLAVGSNDDLWFSKNDGTVWEWSTEDLSQALSPPSPVIDIGVGGGSVWVLAGSNTTGCGRKTYRLGGTGWTNMGGCGIQLAVQGDGRAWTRSEPGVLRRYDGSGTSASDWPTVGNETASRIAVSAVPNDVGVAAWKTGLTDDDEDTLLKAWNEQTGAWQAPRYVKSGAWLAVAPRSQPWVVRLSNFTISRQRRD